ncbi:hypothetical protein EZN00_03034 [Clostridium tyrobutyricum]|nr:hypothetical protein EZN00_03034 [Clostridium tyrobutyricum]
MSRSCRCGSRGGNRGVLVIIIILILCCGVSCGDR